jgi:hypothetical protein
MHEAVVAVAAAATMIAPAISWSIGTVPGSSSIVFLVQYGD